MTPKDEPPERAATGGEGPVRDATDGSTVAQPADAGPPYALDHRKGYPPIPRDVINFAPLMREKSGRLVRLWLVIYARARHEAGWVYTASGPVYLERGQAAVGTPELSLLTAISRSAVDRGLRALEKLGLVGREPGRNGTVITVRHFGEFGEESPSNRDTAQSKNGKQTGTQAAQKVGRDPGTKERGNGGKGRKGGKEKHLPPQAHFVASELATAIRSRDPKAKTNAKRWAEDLDLLHRSDGRSWEEIQRVAAWAQADSFWSGVVLSGASLRRNFGKLVQAMQRNRPAQGTGYARGDDEFGSGEIKL